MTEPAHLVPPASTGELRVDPAHLTAAARVARRQQDHLAEVKQHLDTHGRQPGAFSGVLSLFAGSHDDALAAAVQGLARGGRVAAGAARAAERSRDALLEQDGTAASGLDAASRRVPEAPVPRGAPGSPARPGDPAHRWGPVGSPGALAAGAGALGLHALCGPAGAEKRDRVADEQARRRSRRIAGAEDDHRRRRDLLETSYGVLTVGEDARDGWDSLRASGRHVGEAVDAWGDAVDYDRFADRGHPGRERVLDRLGALPGGAR
ncbi:MAG: hypothetical protein CMH83_13795 [Nocardioides sp.]|nr:hypothetical protein [Nocardioides sp.]